MQDSIAQIATLLEETKLAHHQAFLSSAGDDPDWPLWYAGYLLDKLPPLLQAEMTRSELTYWMVLLSKEQEREAPDSRWSHYYAASLVGEFL